jgi:predicted  nucleic acid-binding Zn-ribbon protein
MLFGNFYRCARCGHGWTDVWSATCDDDCPHCGVRHMSPDKSEDVEHGHPAVDATSASDPAEVFISKGRKSPRNS